MSKKSGDILHRVARPAPRLIYRYSLLKSILVKSIFLALCATVWIFVRPYSPVVTLVVSIIALILLYHLLKTCSVKVWLDWPNLIYKYHSCFRTINKTIPSWEISGIFPEITSIWRGTVTERLVLEVGGRKLVLTPYYSKRDLKTAMLMTEIHNLPSSREHAESEIVLERQAIKRAEGGNQDEEERMKEAVWCMLEMSIECPRCDGPVVVNGPFTEFTCPHCGEDIQLSHEIWADLLEDVRDELADDMEEGEGSRSVIWGTFNTSLYYGRLHPYCSGCKRDFDIVNEYTGGNFITCSDCGTETAVLTAPVWFDKVFEGASLIVGAQKNQSAKHGADSGKAPISFTCSQCGASFKVRGDERSVKCEHCGTSVYIPDELWLHFHPAPTKQRWFIGFEAEVDEWQDE